MIPVLRIRDAYGNVREIVAIRGAKGKSAYDIAKENGFEGSEADWLASLKGAAGSVRTINDIEPDENGNVIIDLDMESLTINGVSYDGSKAVEIKTEALTINGRTYDGSEPVNIDIDVPTEEEIKAIVDAKIVVGTAAVADGAPSEYPEGTLYIVSE